MDPDAPAAHAKAPAPTGRTNQGKTPDQQDRSGRRRIEVNAYVMRWMRKKFKRLRGRKKAQMAWNQAVSRRPRFFAHWAWTTHAPRVW
ncbi:MULTISPECIES: hypothetical protein [unclassified Streptomyces]|uniref:hypothetical protein n=1 Tax=unclassified Streptomyces TaxID=2593676 RepID=UPI003D91A856